MLKIRKASTAPELTMATPARVVSALKDATQASANSATKAMEPARPSMPSSMLKAFIAPTMARQVKALAPIAENWMGLPQGLPSDAMVRSEDDVMTMSAAARCAVRRA